MSSKTQTETELQRIKDAVEAFTEQTSDDDVEAALKRLAAIDVSMTRVDAILSTMAEKAKRKRGTLLGDYKTFLGIRKKGTKVSTSGPEPGPEADILEAANERYGVVRIAKNTYIAEIPQTPRDVWEFRSLQGFKLWNLSRERETDAWLRWDGRRNFKKIVFAPNAEDQDDVINTWRGFALEPIKGDWSKMRHHILHVLADGDLSIAAYIVCWIAQLIQDPANRTGTALVFVGGQSAGKSIVSRAISELFPLNAAVIAKADQLTGRFNAMTAEKVLIVAEEAFFGGDQQRANILKSFITDDKTVIERKGIDPIEIDNHARLWINTNEAHAIAAEGDSRRYMVSRVNDMFAHKGDGPSPKWKRQYFNELLDETYGADRERERTFDGIQAMYYDLLRLPLDDLTSVGKIDLRVAPATSALDEQKRESLSTDRAWLLSVVENGAVIWKDGKATHTFSLDEKKGSKGLSPYCQDDTSARIIVGNAGEKRVAIKAEVLREAYRQSLGRQYGHEVKENRFGVLMKSAGVTKVKHGRDEERYYVFPPLAELRADVFKLLGLGERRDRMASLLSMLDAGFWSEFFDVQGAYADHVARWEAIAKAGSLEAKSEGGVIDFQAFVAEARKSKSVIVKGLKLRGCRFSDPPSASRR